MEKKVEAQLEHEKRIKFYEENNYVKAIKDGMVDYIPARSWELTKGNRDGWERFENISPEKKIPVQQET